MPPSPLAGRKKWKVANLQSMISYRQKSQIFLSPDFMGLFLEDQIYLTTLGLNSFSARIILAPTCVQITELWRYEPLDKLHKIGTEFYIFTPLLTPDRIIAGQRSQFLRIGKKYSDTSSDKHGWLKSTMKTCHMREEKYPFVQDKK